MLHSLERLQTPADSIELIDFLREHVNPATTKETVLWQFQLIPGKAVLIAGKDCDRIICTQSFLPHTLRIGQEKIDTVKSEHSFLLSNYRGTPVFTDAYAMGLNTAKAEGSSICWGFTPAVKVWRDRLGFEVHTDIMYECRALIGWPRIQWTRFPRGIFKVLQDMIRYARATFFQSKVPAPIDEYTISSVVPKETAISQLIDSITEVGTVYLSMDEAFVRWRLDENPNVNYHVRTFELNGKLRGYMVVALSTNVEQVELQLSEFLFLEKSDGLAMLKVLLAEFGKESSTVLRYFGNRSNPINRRVFELLVSRFACDMVLSQGMSLVVMRDKRAHGHDVSKWYINALWTQGFTR
ncbi:MAG: hypothetical protein WBB32_04630 [Flavobacteriales bacterium]